MSARDRFREAEKQSMKAYNRRRSTPPTNIVLENEAEPLSTDVRTSGRFAGLRKGLYEPIFEGGDPFPFQNSDAERRKDEIRRASDLQKMSLRTKMESQPFLSNKKTYNQGISELFGDTEMGFDFLRRSNFNDKMQAGLRDTRPMSQYINFKPTLDDGEFFPSTLGTVVNVDGSPTGIRYTDPAQGLNMQTSGSNYFKPKGGLGRTTPSSITINSDLSAKDQEQALFHELLHKGDYEMQDRILDANTPIVNSRARSNIRLQEGLSPLDSDRERLAAGRMVGEIVPMRGEFAINEDSKIVAALENEAFANDLSHEDLEAKIDYAASYYMDDDDRVAILDKVVKEVGKEFYDPTVQLLVSFTYGAPSKELKLPAKEARKVFDIMNEVLRASVSEREAAKLRNLEVLKAAEDFSRSFAKGGIISALRRENRKASGN